MSKQTDKRIAKLEREIAELKKANAAQPPTPPASTFKPMSDAEWFDQMHQGREARANAFRFSPKIQRAMDEVWSPDDCRDVNRASHAPQGPSQAGVPSSSTITSVHPGGGARVAPGGGTGWRSQREWGADGQHPTPGVAQADRIADAFAAQDRAELAERLAKQQR